MNRTVPEIRAAKGKEKLAVLTAYDFQTAAMLDEAGVDMILVGDSLGNVVYGQPTTLSVDMDTMIRHTRAVSSAAKQALVIGDMPFASYQSSIDLAFQNAARFLGEGGAQAIKLEGGKHMAPTIKRLTECGVPVMGHVGLTPQSLHQLGGYRMQGERTPPEADRLHLDALAVAEAGAFAVVLECVDPKLAADITRTIPIPTIGIGAGDECDGQVLVVNDAFGYTVSHVPKFVKPVANLREIITEAARSYVTRIKGKSSRD